MTARLVLQVNSKKSFLATRKQEKIKRRKRTDSADRGSKERGVNDHALKPGI